LNIKKFARWKGFALGASAVLFKIQNYHYCASRRFIALRHNEYAYPG